MKFSVIVPIYNVERYLSACLDSVQGQTCPDFEVILVNDGSTDTSPKIAATYADGKENWHLIHQKNQGLSGARNTGLAHAHGDYILFLDSDDWLELDAIQILSDSIGDEDLVCFNGRRYLEDFGTYERADKIVPERYRTGWDYYSRNALHRRLFAFVCVVLRCYRRQYLLDAGLRFKTGIFHEDNLFTPLACYHATATKVIPDVLYDYRVRGKSIMTSRCLKHWEDTIRIANELAAFFVPIPGIEKSTVYQALTHHYQFAFANVSRADDKYLLPLVNWPLYKTVSRTKRRHRVLYSALRISPVLFRWIVNRLS